MKILGGYEALVYYSFSLGFSSVKFLAIWLIASEVHSASLVPVLVLYEVPSLPVYCVEVIRNIYYIIRIKNYRLFNQFAK